MRGLVAGSLLALTAMPALAWEARVERICILEHQGDNASVRLTYDPAAPRYSISVTPQVPWAGAPVFGMRFDGPRSNMITTNRHVLSDGGSTVTVTDSGFGNVLDGLEFNTIATALLGDQAVAISLEGAAPAVRAFRACAAGLNA